MAPSGSASAPTGPAGTLRAFVEAQKGPIESRLCIPCPGRPPFGARRIAAGKAAGSRPPSQPSGGAPRRLLTRGREGPSKGHVNVFPLRICILAMAIATGMAEDMALPTNTMMRGDRILVSLKAGTVVEVLSRGDKTITIRYKGQTGTISTSSVTAAPGAPVASAAAKPAVPVARTGSPAPNSVVVDHPQSFYGNLVKKAEISVAKHDENLVKPANEAADDSPSK
jgi:hypothetical protein